MHLICHPVFDCKVPCGILESWRYQLRLLNHTPGQRLLLYLPLSFKWEVIFTVLAIVPRKKISFFCELEYLTCLSRGHIVNSFVLGMGKDFQWLCFASVSATGGSD